MFEIIARVVVKAVIKFGVIILVTALTFVLASTFDFNVLAMTLISPLYFIFLFMIFENFGGDLNGDEKSR